MTNFSPGDRVVAINTDMSGPIHADPSAPDAYGFPDGPLRPDTIYHVATVLPSKKSSQSLYISGMRVIQGKSEIPWSGCRFRKVVLARDFVKKKKTRKQPLPTHL